MDCYISMSSTLRILFRSITFLSRARAVLFHSIVKLVSRILRISFHFFVTLVSRVLRICLLR